MAKLLRYMDGKVGCWSRVNLENGEPVWISVAQTGVIVKKSRMGFMGLKLYSESEVHSVAKTAKALEAQITNYSTPPEMTNPVLRAFTQVALECKSAAELSVRLNRAVQSEAGNNPMLEKNIEKSASRQQIISDYGEYIAHKRPAGEIRDVSELPYPKEEILHAIMLEMISENNHQRLEAMKACAVMLADFQENVGSRPLTMLGISNSELLAAVTSSDHDLKNLATRITASPDQKKYEVLRKIADEEIVIIQSKLRAAEEVIRQMREEKKHKIPG